MTELKKIANEFLTRIETKRLELKNLPPYIFFCGGEVDEKEEKEEKEPKHILSLRNEILLHIKTHHKELNENVILAERFRDWLEDANINNLIDFEVLLAGLASNVVLIVEGPGAYAELGAFSVIPEIYPKLITIYNKKSFIENEKTFIEWGPIKYLESRKTKLFAYEWDVEFQVKDNKVKQVIKNDYNVQTLIKLISAKINKETIQNKTTRHFDENESSSKCLLIAELVFIFSVIKHDELYQYVNDIEEIKIEEKEFSEYLYSLRRLDFIEEKNIGDKYYIPTEKNKGFIKYRFHKDQDNPKRLSSTTIKAEIMALYMDSDPERCHALGMKIA